MPSTKDILLDDKLKLIVYGPFKSGKTWGALTFPRPNVIDFDHGIRTVLNPDFVAKYGLKHVEYFQPVRNTDSRGVPKDYNAFDAACKYFDQWMAKDKVDQFDTWVLDSCTTLIDVATDKAIMLLGGNQFKGAGSGTYDEAKQFGLVVPKLQDYGAERSMTEQFVRMIKDSGKHVVIICHEADSDKSGTGPLLTGKSKQDIPIMFDEIYRLRSVPFGETFKRSLQTQPTGSIHVGSRLGVPDNSEWTFDSVNKIISDIRTTQRSLQAAPQPAGPGSK